MIDTMPAQPLVSIVVPAYNAAQTVHETLASLVAQTYPHIEIVVVDDASTDATPDIIAGFADRVRSYRQPQNLGNYPNVNDGVARAKGDLIAVYHADDVYDPYIVEREVAFLQAHSEVGAVFCKDVFIDAQGGELGRLVLPPSVRGDTPLDYATVLNALLTYKNRFLRCPSSMVRRSVYERIGPYRAGEWGITSDLDMWLRIARHYQLGIVDEHLFRYRRGHGSWSDHHFHLRTTPDGYFDIMDMTLAEGGRALARPHALAAYEAHRAEDRLMRVIAYYILDRPLEARKLLAIVSPRCILASPRVQRDRLLVLYGFLLLMLRLPRVPAIAERFRRRWHSRISR